MINEKIKSIFVYIWLFSLLICVFIGILSILKFDYSGFFALLYTIGSVIFAINLSAKEEEKKIKKCIEISKKLYSLDYSNLDKIKEINLSPELKCVVTLKNDLNITIKDEYIPQNQEKLIALDNYFKQ